MQVALFTNHALSPLPTRQDTLEDVGRRMKYVWTPAPSWAPSPSADFKWPTVSGHSAGYVWSRWLIGILSRQLFDGGPVSSDLFWLPPRDNCNILVDHCLETDLEKATPGPFSAPRRGITSGPKKTTQPTQITRNRTPNKQSTEQQQTIAHWEKLIH